MLRSKKTQKTSASDATIAALDRTQAIIWLEPTGNILEANQNFLEIFGHSAEDVAGQPYDMLADNGAMKPGFWSNLSSGNPGSGTFAHRKKDGSAVFLDTSFMLVSGDGHPDKIMGIATDVTANHIAAVQAGKLKDTLETTQAVVEYDEKGNILRANAKFLEMTGYASEAVVGRHRNQFVIEADGDTNVWNDVVLGKTTSALSQQRAKAGDPLWLQETFCLHDGPSNRHVVSIVTDVTKAMKDTAASAGPDIAGSFAAIELSSDGKILWASDKFLKLSGYQLKELIGKAYASLFDQSYNLVAGFPDTLKEASSAILPIKTRSGETCWYRNDFAEKDGRYIASVIDVTAWKNESDALSGAITKMAGGSLAVRLPDTGAKEWEKSRSAFNDLAGNLQKMISEAVDLSSLILGESGAIADSSQALSERCEQQAASVEETSTAMEEMSSSVRSTAQSAKEATEAATNATGFAQKGQKIVDDAIVAMNKIEDGSGEVRKIIEVIDAIAFQTNLLALNAGVEAARAGDAGRGFAVVASEVRALAQRASDSARDINTLIESSGTQVKEGAALVNQTGEALTEIVDAVAQVSTGIEGIFLASTEQSEGVQEINQAISDIDSNTQKTAAISEESTASAKLLAEKAHGLQNLIQYFQIGDQLKRNAGSEKPAPIPRAVSPQSPPKAVRQAPPKPARVAAPPVAQGAVALQIEDDDDGWDEF